MMRDCFRAGVSSVLASVAAVSRSFGQDQTSAQPTFSLSRPPWLRTRAVCFLATLLVACAARPSFGQQTPDPTPQGAPSSTPAAAPAAPAPLPAPSMSGPLATAIPHEISAGPFGKLEVTGILSG